MKTASRLLLGLFLVGGGGAGSAQTAPRELPQPLEPWAPWVLAGKEASRCTLGLDQRTCVWPGRLQLELDDRGGRFSLDVVADIDTTVELPGDAQAWPRDLQLDSRSALLVPAERPTVEVPAGRHRIEGRFLWPRAPETLPLPGTIGLVDVTLRGQRIARPAREADGTLRLTRHDDAEVEADGLEIETQRRLIDGVPLVLETRVVLRVAGRAREIGLPSILPEGFELAWLEGELPLRAEADGTLAVQLRPGVWAVSLWARSNAAVAEIVVPTAGAPWPADEVWSFQPAPLVRSARLDGGRPIDPQRTSIPEAWYGSSTVMIEAGQRLTVVEFRRGQPLAPADQLAVSRELRLSLDGATWIARDRISGSIGDGGRLEVVAPAELGRAALDDEAQVVTVGADGGAGVEVRSEQVALEADSLVPRGGAMAAVGWRRDAQSLSVDLDLPPGWSLIAAPGVDIAGGAWVSEWTLLDLFLLLVLVFGTDRLVSRRVAVVTAVALVLVWHQRGGSALVWSWLVLLPLLALAGRLGEGRIARLVAVCRTLVLVVWMLAAVALIAAEWKGGWHPQLGGSPPAQFINWERNVAMAPQAPAERSLADAAGEYMPSSAMPKRKMQVDPAAIVQTGPGVPTWSWKRCRLQFSGPVSADHQMRLLLLGPFANLVLALARILLVVWVMVQIVRAALQPREPTRDDAGLGRTAAAVALLLVVLPLSSPAAAQFPPAELLTELETRLQADPPCAPRCLELAAMELVVAGQELRLELEAHAAAPTTLRLPGPVDAFVPSSVRVDGVEVAGLRLGADRTIELRLSRGVSRITVTGRVAEGFTLQLPDRPRTLRVDARDWVVAGWREDAPPPAALRLDRLLDGVDAQTPGAGTRATTAQWLEVTRRLELGLRAEVVTTVRRLGPLDTPMVVQIPVLAGETPTTAGVDLVDGAVTLAFERGEGQRTWQSTIAADAVQAGAGALALEATTAPGLFEVWELACSVLWRCEAEGVVPVGRMRDGIAQMSWRPWPGEKVAIDFARAAAAEGATATFERTSVELTPGRRLRETVVELTLRTSRGGQHRVEIPSGATLLEVAVDGTPVPLVPNDGAATLALDPGSHQLRLALREDQGVGLLTRSPAITVDAPAVDLHTTIAMPRDRWILAVGGPAWGPVVTMWLNWLVIALVAAFLGTFVPTPLTVMDWFLLGLGLSQLPLPVIAWVPLTLCALAWRHRAPGRRWWSWNFQQLALFVALLIAVGVLWGGIHTGLLMSPDMQVEGASSSGSTLRWYVDRSPGDLPTAWVLSLPLWCWRAVMLAWALWLASRVVRWSGWVWQRLSEGPLLAPPSWSREEEAEQASDGSEPGNL
jgi:hypothetical protein